MAQRLKLSISVTGFEPIDLLLGIYHDIRLLEAGKHSVYNAYPGMVDARKPQSTESDTRSFRSRVTNHGEASVRFPKAD